MKIYISADMEGVAGITAVEQTNPVGQPEYARSCELMTGEVNAACEGAFAAGAQEILVNDSHWNMRNIIHEELPPHVRLIRGSPKAAVDEPRTRPNVRRLRRIVGYHGGAGTQDAVLDHTYTAMTLYEVSINGQTVQRSAHQRCRRGNVWRAGRVPVRRSDRRAPMPAVSCRGLRRSKSSAPSGAMPRSHSRPKKLAPRSEPASNARCQVPRRVGRSPTASRVRWSLELRFTYTVKADMAALMPGASGSGDATSASSTRIF